MIYKIVERDYSTLEAKLNELERTPLNKDLFAEFEREFIMHKQVKINRFYKLLKRKLRDFRLLIDSRLREIESISSLIKFYHSSTKDEEKAMIIRLIKASFTAHSSQEKKEILGQAEGYFTADEAQILSNEFKEKDTEDWAKL